MAMLHPTYNDLMETANRNVAEGEEPVVKSRYSVVIAAAKRARQIIDGAPELVYGRGRKPLSVAVDELYQSKVEILGEGSAEEEAAPMAEAESGEAALSEEAEQEA